MEFNSAHRNPAVEPPTLNPNLGPQVDDAAIEASCCSGCGYIAYPGLTVCPECLSQDHAVCTLSGNGTLYSFSRVHVGAHATEGPYVVGYVDTPEGARLFASITDSEDLRIDAPVRLVENAAPPKFSVVGEGNA